MKYKNAILRFSVYALLGILTVSCKKEAVLEDHIPVRQPVKLKVPGNFPDVTADADNPQTLEGIELGRKLFYDVRLSGSNRISCASCHRQELAFTDGLALSKEGASGKELDRHAPALFNLAWAKSGLFWDGGSKNLESQAFGPLTSPDEMHQDLFVLEDELQQIPEYVKQFELVFGGEIKSTHVVKALAQFQRTLISAGSRYDQYKRGEAGAVLDGQELLGMELLNTKCKGCHSGELFTDDRYHNNGIDDNFSEKHGGIFQGQFRISFNPEDLGKFKTPSLRNVLLTAPYMHDGRFKTIDEVLDHYQHGIKVSATTDALLYQKAGLAGIPMTTEERVAIKAFLATLTDTEFITSLKIGDPYKK